MTLLEEITAHAREKSAHLVLPEGDDERVITAYRELLRQKVARKVTLIGDEEKIAALATKLGIEVNPADIINPANAEKVGVYATALYERRKHKKNMTLEKAVALCKDRVIFGHAMVAAGDADASVCGCVAATAQVIRAALYTVGLAEGMKTLSSSFLMVHPDESFGFNGAMLYGDCAVMPNPDASQLADIAIATATTTRRVLGIEPLVAMLSFSTKGSASHELADKVITATEQVQQRFPELTIDGEMQLDTALVPAVGKKKAPGSPVARRANTLIFPDLNAGNIGYKLTQRLGGAEAYGPILQGTAKPIADLSRGASTEDIVNTAIITISQVVW
ncbi:phosphate acetyltransferase [bacterium]|nr:phosphate acetyltransferase [bacterium]